MSRHPSPTLCESFRQHASWTARNLRASAQFGVAFNEETITESLLLKLSERHSSKEFRIRSWSKTDEGTGTKATAGLPTGADWDFFFADWTGAGVTVRIQAKRLYPTNRYESLEGTGQQIKDLRNNCGSALPIYIFYNDPSGKWPWPDWRCKPSCTPRFRGDSTWGCSFAPVPGIPKVKCPRPCQISTMRPWHCLVCPCPMQGLASGNLPQRVVGAIRSAYDRLSATDDDRFSGARDLSFETTQSWPDWARRLREDSVVPEGVDARGSGIGDGLNQYLRETDLKGIALIEQLPPEEEG